MGYVPQRINSNEWITIGDYASIDKDNYLYLHGREHDRLIIGGENVYPIEIERAMALNEAVDEVLVIGPLLFWMEFDIGKVLSLKIHASLYNLFVCHPYIIK